MAESETGERRYEYEMVDFGYEGKLFKKDSDYPSLMDAIDDYASRGWRFVETAGRNYAIFERPVVE